MFKIGDRVIVLDSYKILHTQRKHIGHVLRVVEIHENFSLVILEGVAMGFYPNELRSVTPLDEILE